MVEDLRKPLYHLYVDDSGTRHPDRREPTSKVGDWFGLGGFLIKAEDEPRARELHKTFTDKWEITSPLHSVKIRYSSGSFKWLDNLSKPQSREFWSDLDKMIQDLPIICNCCVIDRPGYHARYYEKYGRQRWHLCKSAFTILCERAAKFASLQDRRLKVFVEETDRVADKRIRTYFREMRDGGMPFSEGNSEKYGPLSQEELKFRLLDLGFKKKSSPMIQLADLVLYPLCRAPYDQLYRPWKSLCNAGQVIDQHLKDEQLSQLGMKRYCFDSKQKGP